jgi:predicted ATPase
LVVVRVLLLRVVRQHDEVFFFFLIVCICDVFRHLIGAEVECNWYFHDINVFIL